MVFKVNRGKMDFFLTKKKKKTRGLALIGESEECGNDQIGHGF